MSRRREINLGAYAFLFLILTLGSAICASILAMVQASYEARCDRRAGITAGEDGGAIDESPGQVPPARLQTPALPTDYAQSTAIARTPRIGTR